MSIRKRAMLAFSAALAAGVLAAVALGQEDSPIHIAATVKVTPDKAGTPSRPRGIGIDVRATIDKAGETGPPMPRSVDVWFPKGWRYNGAKHPACARATLASGGPTACPSPSIMTQPVGHADVVDGTVPLSVIIINGGRTKMYFWIVLRNPARVAAAVPGTIIKLNSSRWSYRLHADVPLALQVVAGVPIVVDVFRASVRRGDWIATTGCPRDHRWRYHVETGYTSGQVVITDGAVPCWS